MVANGSRVVVITVEGQLERQRRTRDNLARMGFLEYTFHVTQRHPAGGKAGCFVAHTEVILDALADPSCEFLYVFEDDVRPSPAYSRGIMRGVAQWMSTEAEPWNIIWCGYTFLRADKPLESGVMEFMAARQVTRNLIEYHGPALLTHAYILNRRGMALYGAACRNEIAAVAGQLHNIRHIDAFFADLAAKNEYRHQLCVVPMQMDQHWCLPTLNMNADTPVFERISRMLACSAERSNIFTLLSYFRQHRVAVCLFIVCVTLVISYAVYALTMRIVNSLRWSSRTNIRR